MKAQMFAPLPAAIAKCRTRETREWTPRAMAQLGLTDPAFADAAPAPLTKTCVAACLSVIVSKSHNDMSKATGVVGQLSDRGVMTTILEFAASPVRRVIFIEPNIKDPVANTTVDQP